MDQRAPELVWREFGDFVFCCARDTDVSEIFDKSAMGGAN